MTQKSPGSHSCPTPFFPLKFKEKPNPFLRILVSVSAGNRHERVTEGSLMAGRSPRGGRKKRDPQEMVGHLGPARVGSCVHPSPEGAEGGSGYQTSVRAAAIGEGRPMELGPFALALSSLWEALPRLFRH